MNGREQDSSRRSHKHMCSNSYQIGTPNILFLFLDTGSEAPRFSSVEDATTQLFLSVQCFRRYLFFNAVRSAPFGRKSVMLTKIKLLY